MLGGADKVEILPLDLIHHGVHLGLAHDALHHVAVDHEGGDAEGEALVDHEVAGVGQHRLVEAGDVAHQVVEARAGYPAGGVHVDAVEGLHDLGVVGDFKGGGCCLAEALHLHVAGVVGADGHGGIDDVGDLEQDAADLRGQLGLRLRDHVFEMGFMTSAFSASASASLEGSFLDCPISTPTCLLLALRAVRSSWASWMVRRFSASSSST